MAYRASFKSSQTPKHRLNNSITLRSLLVQSAVLLSFSFATHESFSAVSLQQSRRDYVLRLSLIFRSTKPHMIVKSDSYGLIAWMNVLTNVARVRGKGVTWFKILLIAGSSLGSATCFRRSVWRFCQSRGSITFSQSRWTF